MKVSFYRNVFNPNPIKSVELIDVLNIIKNPPEVLKEKVDLVRDAASQDNTKLVKHYKERLPAVTFNGQFYYRSNISLMTPSGYMYIDIDDYLDKETIKQIPQVKAIWTSSSGKGLGVLVKVGNINNLNYKSTYNRVIQDFIDLNIKVDYLSDLSRVTILSYDYEMYYRDDCLEYATIEPEIFSHQVDTGKIEIKSEAYEAALLSLISTSKQYSFIEGQRHNFTIKYFCFCNILGVDLETAYQVAAENLCVSADSYSKAVDVYKRYAASHGINKYRQSNR